MNSSRSSQALQPLWLVATLFAPLLLQAGAEDRTWTDLQGRQLHGCLSAIRSGAVEILLAKDRRQVSIPLQLLSSRDLRYVEICEQLRFGQDSPRWPSELGPMLNFTPRLESNQPLQGWVYITPNFRFHCDVELAPSLIKEYSLAFEGTCHAIQKLPLQLNPKPALDRFSVRLIETRENYLRAGGPKGSAGVYLLRTREILVPLESLGVRTVGSRVAIDRKAYDSGTLVHEITHQVMHDWLDVLPIWFVEGFAEYMAAIPCSQGRFSFRDVHEGVLKRLADDHRVARNRNGSLMVDLAPPEQVMSLTHQQWTHALSSAEEAALNYRSAMLLVYFFLHLDGSADGVALASYLQQARSGQEALESFVAKYNGAVEDYNSELAAYNEAVSSYNQSLLRFREAVKHYNSRVRTYNSQLEQGIPEDQLIVVGPEPGPPPAPPRKPEMPTILARNGLAGGTLDLGEAEKKAREALTRLRSPLELWQKMAAALAERGITARPVNALPGASLADYNELRQAPGRK